jgi:uncharacterized protein (TIGR02147 family)
MQSIFEYFDYRKYLADFYAYRKKVSKSFSYRTFNSKAGITSPVFLKLVIDGKRNLGMQTIEKFSKALNLNKKESLFFKKLVLFDQTKNPDEKQEHYTTLRSLRKNVSEKALNSAQYEYFSTWYHAVIREIVTIYDFRNDYQLLANALHPPISASEAKASLELLIKLNLLKTTENGAYKQVNTAIVTEGEMGLVAVRHFNRCMLSNALRAIDDFDKNMRHISGLTIGVSRSMYSSIESEINAFKDRIVSLVNRDEESSSVYQLNFQLFPLSKSKEEIASLRKDTTA